MNNKALIVTIGFILLCIIYLGSMIAIVNKI